MAANLVRAVASHDADDDAADDGHQHHPVAERRTGRANHRQAEAVVVEEIGEEGDGAQEQDSQRRAADAYDDGEAGDQPDAAIDGEVAKSGGVALHRAPRTAARGAGCAAGAGYGSSRS